MNKGFVYLTDIDPTILESVRYASAANFTGRVVDGYSKRIICTEIAAQKLKKVHDALKKQGYNLVVYDGYRPASVPMKWVEWSKDDNDIIAKPYYYPTINKKDMFDLGFVVKKSSHSRGSTFDLTLIKLGHKVEDVNYSTRFLANTESIPFLDDGTVNMGSSFDLFHESSFHASTLVDKDAQEMRRILKEAMNNGGFDHIEQEWWHYTLRDEPHKDTYFDFYEITD